MVRCDICKWIEGTEITVINSSAWCLFLVTLLISMMVELPSDGVDADAHPFSDNKRVFISEFPRPGLVPILTTVVRNPVLMTLKWRNAFYIRYKKNR